MIVRIHLEVLKDSPARAELLKRGRVEDEFLTVEGGAFAEATQPYIRWRFGDWLHWLLWPIWKRLGGNPNCGCAKRAERLNALGKRLRSWIEF